MVNTQVMPSEAIVVIELFLDEEIGKRIRLIEEGRATVQVHLDLARLYATRSSARDIGFCIDELFID